MYDMSDDDGYEVAILKDSNDWIDILINPKQLRRIEYELTQRGGSVTILNNNIDVAIREEKTCSVRKIRSYNTGSNYNFNNFFKCFQSLEKHHEFLEQLAMNHKSDAATFDMIGKSYEGKALKVIRISKDLKNSASKPVIWIDGGMHAREWVSLTTAQWIAATLLGEVDTSLQPEINKILEKYQFFILPVSNPDGYDYSFGSWIYHSRLWRKTRSFRKDSPCKGVDPNRNFDDINFNQFGTSNSKCKEIYAGKSAFSENNTKWISKKLDELGDKVKLYLSYHSYGQMFFTPYYSIIRRTKHARIHDAAGLAYTEAIHKTHGETYVKLQAAEFKKTSGTSASWMYMQKGVINSYTVELRDKGEKGFVLPPSEIVPIGEENVRGLIALINQLKYEF